MLSSLVIEVSRDRHIPSKVRLPIHRPGFPIIDWRDAVLDLRRSLSSEEILGTPEKGHVEKEQVGNHEYCETQQWEVRPRPGAGGVH